MRKERKKEKHEKRHSHDSNNRKTRKICVSSSAASDSLDSSDSPGVLLVSKQFDGAGLNAWKRAMVIALSAKKKLGFATGEVKQLDSNSPLLNLWSRCNSMVINWILNALSKEIVDCHFCFYCC
ncbi:hypothetical protein L6164_008628 [Bauhinia variegata]|uniref:Uncharacterized protein n=1 Tax=Bauhinia variegata TaxID=167791 RepID=A0ACB9PK37_BAUVA|nr:hypothetical protein L6164_008628 [Bauhinia variegata]